MAKQGFVSARNAAGRTVIVTGLPGEEPATATCVSVDIKWPRTATMRFKDHPTCGTFTYLFPSAKEFELNEKPAPKGVRRR